MSHVYGHSCVTLEVHMCQESLCCRRVCVSAVCSNEACVWIWPHISVGLCDYVCMCLSALSLGVSASVPECAFEWDCEFVCPSVSLCVCFSVWVSIWTGFPVRLCISGRSVCPPTVLEHTSAPLPCTYSPLAARTLQESGIGLGLGPVGAVGDGGGGETRSSEAAATSHIPAGTKEARPAPALTPVTCLPTHAGLPETLPPCLAKPGGPRARGQSSAS